LDRRTDRLDGSGGGSPTVVTSRATGDDLIDDEQDAQSNGGTVPSTRSPQQPTAAKSAPAKAAPPDGAGSDGTMGAGLPANGALAVGNGIEGIKGASANGSAVGAAKGTGLSAADATIADGMPALPADTIGASRSSRPNGPDPDRETAASKVAEQPPADDSPAFSFGPPPSAPARPAEAAADPAQSAGMIPWGADTSRSRTMPPGPGPSGRASSGRPASSVPSALADPPPVSRVAFAWEMADAPAGSPSSPARTLLGSGTSAEGSAAPRAASNASPGKAGAGKTAAGEGPVTTVSPARKGKSKRTARQAHLTVARVEPWSVMKFSFVVSLVAFVILFVAVSVLYGVLSSLGVFDSLQRVVQSVTSSQASAGVNAKAWFSASKVLGYTALLGSLNIVLITAMATIGSVVYNLTSRLVGGVEVTLRETE
jgi:hypothetical protein